MKNGETDDAVEHAKRVSCGSKPSTGTSAAALPRQEAAAQAGLEIELRGHLTLAGSVQRGTDGACRSGVDVGRRRCKGGVVEYVVERAANLERAGLRQPDRLDERHVKLHEAVGPQGVDAAVSVGVLRGNGKG